MANWNKLGTKGQVDDRRGSRAMSTTSISQPSRKRYLDTLRSTPETPGQSNRSIPSFTPQQLSSIKRAPAGQLPRFLRK